MECGTRGKNTQGMWDINPQCPPPETIYIKEYMIANLFNSKNSKSSARWLNQYTWKYHSSYSLHLFFSRLHHKGLRRWCNCHVSFLRKVRWWKRYYVFLTFILNMRSRKGCFTWSVYVCTKLPWIKPHIW